MPHFTFIMQSRFVHIFFLRLFRKLVCWFFILFQFQHRFCALWRNMSGSRFIFNSLYRQVYGLFLGNIFSRVEKDHKLRIRMNEYLMGQLRVRKCVDVARNWHVFLAQLSHDWVVESLSTVSNDKSLRKSKRSSVTHRVAFNMLLTATIRSWWSSVWISMRHYLNIV